MEKKDFIPTANRMRPQNFSSVEGQNFIVSTLKNSIESNKIARAYLFSGHRGVGKTTSARILAKALNCKNGPTITPCEKCESCKSITNGTSLDVIEIDGASNTSIESIKDIKNALTYPPINSKYKIYIIDEVHMLSTSAFNALLKTIEEPPEWAVFIFATTELQKVPLTIRSRCQQFSFHSLDINTLSTLIKKGIKNLNIKADEDSILWLSKEAKGSARDAYTLLDQIASMCNGNITFDKIKKEFGEANSDFTYSTLNEAIIGNTQKAFLNLDELLKTTTPSAFLKTSINFFRIIQLIKIGIENTDLLLENIELIKNFQSIKLLSLEQISNGLDTAITYYKKLTGEDSDILECRIFISYLSILKNYKTNETLVGELAELKNNLIGALNENNRLEIQISEEKENTYNKKDNPTKPDFKTTKTDVTFEKSSVKKAITETVVKKEKQKEKTESSKTISKAQKAFLKLGGTLVED